VTETATKRVYITEQNHGWTLKSASLPVNATEIFVNANDNTCEGIHYTDMPAISVQFNPAGGSEDAVFIFDRFINLMQGGQN
ncbi:MAG: carbamoyl phosphate synthase small subunit, partial [Oscillospiraceae bacterium]